MCIRDRAGEIDLNLIDQNISNIQGDVLLRNFDIQRNQNEHYRLDSLFIHSELAADGKRHLDIESEMLNGFVDGFYDIQEVKDGVLYFVERNYPLIAERFNIHGSGRAVKDCRFDFGLNIQDSKNFTQLLNHRLDTLKEIEIIGHFDNQRDSIFLDMEVPYFKYDNVELVDVLFDIRGKESSSNLEFEIYHTNWNGQRFEPITLEGELEHDTLFFDIVSTNFTSIFDDLHLNGRFFPIEDKNYQVSFSSTDLVILKQEWTIEENNYLRFGKGFIEAKNFDLHNDEKRIVLRSLKERGLNPVSYTHLTLPTILLV